MLNSTQLAGAALLLLLVQSSSAAGSTPADAGAAISPEGWTVPRGPSAALLMPFQAEPKISGTVTDETGAPIPGVSVQIKGTSKGVATSPEGRFTITIPNDNTILVFSFIGTVTREIAV